MTTSEVASRLQAFYRAIYPHMGQALELDTDLLNDWFVDSFGVVQTVQFLEDSFAIEVRRADVNAENFRSVRALAEFVVRRRR